MMMKAKVLKVLEYWLDFKQVTDHHAQAFPYYSNFDLYSYEKENIISMYRDGVDG